MQAQIFAFIVKYKWWFIGIAALIIGWFTVGKPLINWIKRNNKTKGQKQELSDVTTTIENLQQQGVKLTYQPSQYSTWANQLVQAFDGCGTGWETVKNIFTKLRNNLDVAILIDSYGVRSYDKCNWSEAWLSDFTGSLSESLVDELDEDELKELNGWLKSNGINYSF